MEGRGVAIVACLVALVLVLLDDRACAPSSFSWQAAPCGRTARVTAPLSLRGVRGQRCRLAAGAAPSQPLGGRRHARKTLGALLAAAALPSVSVQVVTYERPRLLLEALAQIWAQDYQGDLEVVVLDDSAESTEERVLEFAECASMTVKYQHLPYRCSLGGKRNLAASCTEADVICIWDDDDIFPTDRISRQVKDLLAGKDCSYIETVYYYSFVKERLNVHARHVPGLPIENSLCFWRAWFERGRGFNPVNFGEGLWLFDFRLPPEGAEAAASGGYAALASLVPDNVAMVPAAELPFLYVKHGVSVSGDQVEEDVVRRYDRPNHTDPQLLGLARGLLQGQLPALEGLPAHSAALRGAGRAVAIELCRDLGEMRRHRDVKLATEYWQELLGGDAGVAEPAAEESPGLEEVLAALEAACGSLAAQD